MNIALATRPTVVCLCGSTRFSEAFREANFRETLAGRIVLTIGCDFKSDEALGLGESDKARLDALHLRKIERADEVLILNVGGYVGESTSRELAYAVALGKRVRFLEEDKAPHVPLASHNGLFYSIQMYGFSWCVLRTRVLFWLVAAIVFLLGLLVDALLYAVVHNMLFCIAYLLVVLVAGYVVSEITGVRP